MNEVKYWRSYMNKLHEEQCKIPYKNLGYDKDQMPQIKEEMIQSFLIDLREQNIEVFETKIKVSDLQPSQGSLQWEKVQSLMKTGFDKLKNGTPIFVSKDNIICDGHHRYYALKMIDKNSDMGVFQVQLEADELIKRMKQFENRINGG